MQLTECQANKAVLAKLGNKAGNDCMKTVVIGVGNELKADDGIGLRVAKQLQQDGLQNKETMIIPADVPENWIQPIAKFRPELLVLVDTADFRGKAGEIRAIDRKSVV